MLLESADVALESHSPHIRPMARGAWEKAQAERGVGSNCSAKGRLHWRARECAFVHV